MQEKASGKNIEIEVLEILSSYAFQNEADITFIPIVGVAL